MKKKGWSDDYVKLIGALAGAAVIIIGALAAAGVLSKTETVKQPVPVLAGVQADANNNLSRAEVQEQGAKPITADPTVAPDLSLENVGPEIAQDMRDETPPGISPQESADAEIEAPGVGQPQQPVGAQNYSCTPHYVVNQSPLSGARSGVALHFTVSGPGSLQAIWRLFNTPSFGASSNYGIELDGECEIWVAISRKGWAQGAFNSAYISIEIVTNDLSRQAWLASRIIHDGILASLVADLLRRTGAPPVLVDPVGCAAKAGVTDHSRLECGNTHWDVGPHFPWDVFMAQVRAAYNGFPPVCDAKCKRIRHQRAVVRHRVARHDETHATARAKDCRSLDKNPVRSFTRDVCRDLKLTHRRQRAGIRRARATLRAI